MHPQWKRLLRIGSAPAWIVVIVVICRIIARAANIDLSLPASLMSRLIALWNFLQTPDGNIVFAIAGTAWLVGLVFWPDRSRKTTTDTLPRAVDLPVAEPVVVKPIPGIGDAAEPFKESWVATQGHFMQLIPDQAGCTAVLTSGQRIINARFDETWSWYLGNLKNGAPLSVEGKVSTPPTDRQLHLLDCV